MTRERGTAHASIFSPATFTFTRLDLAWHGIGIILYCLDIGTDVWTGIAYLQEGHMFWGILTLVPVGLTSFLLFIFNLWDLCKEYYSPFGWRLLFFFNFLQLGPLLRSVVFFRLGVKYLGEKVKEKKQWYLEMLQRRNVSVVYTRCIEVVFESAPQFVLQLYIMPRLEQSITSATGLLKVATLLSSWVSLATTLMTMTDVQRQALGKNRLSIVRKIYVFFLRLFESAAHLLCFVFLFSVPGVEGGERSALVLGIVRIIFVAIFFFCMAGCCANRSFIDCLFSQMFCFSFINLTGERSRCRQFWYLVINYGTFLAVVVPNSLLIDGAYDFSNKFTIFVTSVLGICFFLHIGLLIGYYKCFFSTPQARDEQYTPHARDEEYTPHARDEQYTPHARDEQYTPHARDEQYTPQARDEQYTPRPRDEQIIVEVFTITVSNPGPDANKRSTP